MGSISSTDKEKIKLSIPKQFNKIIDVCIAKLYIAYPNPSEWTYTGLYGALCLVDDLVGNTFFLKLVDVSNLNKGVIWDQELYVNFDYIQDRTFFHTFEMEECLAGLLFEDIHEAQHFYKRVTKRSKYGSKNTINNKNAIRLEKELDVEKKASYVQGPRGEELISNQRSRYDYSSKLAANVGYRSDVNGETGLDTTAHTDDLYSSYTFEHTAAAKHAPPPPPPQTPAATPSAFPSSSTLQSSYSEESSYATPEETISAPRTPVHRLPPPPEKYATGPPPANYATGPPPLAHQEPQRLPPRAPQPQGHNPPFQGHNPPFQQHQAPFQQQQQTPMPVFNHTQVPVFNPPPGQQIHRQQPPLPPAASVPAPPQNQSFNHQQTALPPRTGAPPPLPPQRRAGPPPPPRKLAGQATGIANQQPLRSQKTGGRGPPPPPPMRRSATGAAPPPPPVRRMAGQRTGHAAAGLGNGFSVSHVPATTFGAPPPAQPAAQRGFAQSTVPAPGAVYASVNPDHGYARPAQSVPVIPQQQVNHVIPPPPMMPQQQQQQQQVNHVIPPPPPMIPQQQSNAGIPPPPMLPQQQTNHVIPQPQVSSGIPPPPPPMLQQPQSNAGIPPPLPQPQSNHVIPPPPPPMPQTNAGIPPPPPMLQQPPESSGDGSRDALLASIRSAGLGSLRKTDKSQINDRSEVKLASSPTGSAQPMGAQATGGGGLADALAAALNSRKKKVSSYADDDDGDW